MFEKLIQSLRKPSARTLALIELEDAQRQHLAAQSGAEYATRLAEYHLDRIKRLTAYLKESP